MAEFSRQSHRLIGRVLRALNSDVLLEAECYFGGGTHLALTYGEYRESKDIDFLCSSRKGFRLLRESVTQNSLGVIVRTPLRLAREVRADREGIRTFIEIGDVRLKFELLLEGRITLAGALDKKLGVPVLAVETAIAEKFLANADRGHDEATHGRDLIDLAFLAAHVGKKTMQIGLEIAAGAYGKAAHRALAAALEDFRKHRSRTAGWLKSLHLEDTATLRKGLRVLRAM